MAHRIIIGSNSYRFRTIAAFFYLLLRHLNRLSTAAVSKTNIVMIPRAAVNYAGHDLGNTDIKLVCVLLGIQSYCLLYAMTSWTIFILKIVVLASVRASKPHISYFFNGRGVVVILMLAYDCDGRNNLFIIELQCASHA